MKKQKVELLIHSIVYDEVAHFEVCGCTYLVHKKMNILKTIYHFFSSNKKICSLYIKGCNMTILVTLRLNLFWEKGKITSVYHLTTSLNYFCKKIKRTTKKIKNTMMQTDYSKNPKYYAKVFQRKCQLTLAVNLKNLISETSLETALVNIC